MAHPRNRHWLSVALATASLALSGSIIHAAARQPEASAATTGPASETSPAKDARAASATSAPDGATLYAARCAGCHDRASERVPSRQVLSRNPPSFIVSALHNGVMAPMAAGLSLPEMSAIGRYVSKVTDDGKHNQDVDPHRIWGAGVAGTPLDAPRCSGPTPPVNLDAKAQWNGWSISATNSRFQPRPGLTASEVPRLKLKWAFAYPGAKNGQATVIGNRLFVTSMSGAVYSLNAKTGCVYWRHAAGAATRTSVVLAAMPKGSAVRTALFISDWTKSAVALDADTGKPLWRTVIDDQPGEQMTGSITYWDGKLYVPVSSGNEAFAQWPNWVCCKFRGALVALDAATGRVLWKRYTTDTVPHPFKRNRDGKAMWGPSGGSIWTTPTIDAQRRLIYVGTSNSYTDLPYDNADSIMAIDADTGTVSWAHKLTPHDNYIDGCWNRNVQPANCLSPLGPDYSIGVAPILHTLPDGRQVLLAGSKSGWVYGLDPDHDGAVLWQRELSVGSALGGVEFGMAAGPKRLYVGVSDIVVPGGGDPGLWALDPATGKVLWNTPNAPHPDCRWRGRWCHGALSQAISVMPGVVFAGSYDGHFRAYAAATGKVIWNVDTASKPVLALDSKRAYGGVMDGAGPTIAGGMVYVHSGYAGRSGSGGGGKQVPLSSDGNVLMAFSAEGR